MVKIKKIEPPFATVIDPNGRSFIVNEYEFMDLRVQIMEEKKIGWEVVCESGKHCDINFDGRLNYYPKQFHLISDYLNKLCQWGKNKE